MDGVLHHPTTQVAGFFDAVLEKGSDAKQAANWIMGDIAAYLNNQKLGILDTKLTPDTLAELISLIKDATISGKIAKEVQYVLISCGNSWSTTGWLPFR